MADQDPSAELYTTPSKVIALSQSTVQASIPRILALASAGVKPIAYPTTNPGTPKNGDVWPISLSNLDVPYPNFGNITPTSKVGNNYVFSPEFVYYNNAWTFQYIPVAPPDLTGYAKSTQVYKVIGTAYDTLPDLSTTTQNTSGTNVYYVNAYPATASRTVNAVRFKVQTTGTMQIVRVDANYLNPVVVADISNYPTGINEVYFADQVLAAGERIGIQIVTGAMAYSSTTGPGFYASDTSTNVANRVMGYQVGLRPVGATTLADLATNLARIAPSGIGSEVKTAGNIDVQTYAWSLKGGVGNTYFNSFATSTTDATITVFRVNAFAAGNITIVRAQNDYSSRTGIGTFPVVAGYNEIAVNIPLAAGQRLGITPAVQIYYVTTGGVGWWASDINNTGGTAPNNELAYSYASVTPGALNLDRLTTEIKNTEATLATVQTVQNTPKRLSKDALLFQDKMATAQTWTFQGWSFAAGGYTCSAAGVDNRLELPLMYHADIRNARATVTFTKAADLRIHIKFGGLGQSVGEGASMFGINSSTQTINMYGVNSSAYGNNPDNSSIGVTEIVVKSVAIPFAIAMNRDYAIDIEKYDYTNTITLYDTVTGASVSVSSTGWSTGRQNQYYGFYCASGDSVTLKYFDVHSVASPEMMIMGDSQTEGDYVTDKSKRYAELIRLNVMPRTVISARGGAKIDDILTKFDTEVSKMKPKRIMVLIGANGGNTQDKFQSLLDKCTAAGIILIINRMPCQNSNDYHLQAQCNPLIESFVNANNIPSARFDVATAYSNIPAPDPTHPSPRFNPALYGDTATHPNIAGNAEMYKRIPIDLDLLY